MPLKTTKKAPAAKAAPAKAAPKAPPKAPPKMPPRAPAPAAKGAPPVKQQGFASRLSKMNKVWEEASTAAAGGTGGVNENVDVGKHDLQLVEAKLVEVSNGQKIMVQWTFDAIDVGGEAERATDPAYGHVSSRDGLETPQNIGHLKRKLKYFGFDPDAVKAAELEEALKMITAGRPLCKGRVWMSPDGQWQNVQVLGNEPEGWETDPFTGEAPAEEGVEEEAAAEGDELDGLDRNQLKVFIKNNSLEVKVFQNMSDDDIRGKIREAMPQEEAVEEEAAPEEEAVEEEIVEEAAEIVVGSNVLYTPPRAKKAMNCEVHDIDAKGTAKLKNLESGKLLANRVAIGELELAASEEQVEEETAPEAESEFGVVTKGSKVEVAIGGKSFKGELAEDPKEDAQSVKVKLLDGPHKGKVKDIPVDDIEPLE